MLYTRFHVEQTVQNVSHRTIHKIKILQFYMSPNNELLTNSTSPRSLQSNFPKETSCSLQEGTPETSNDWSHHSVYNHGCGSNEQTISHPFRMQRSRRCCQRLFYPLCHGFVKLE